MKHPLHHRQAGISLIELMVGLTIGLMVVMAGLGTVVLSRSSSATVSDQALLASRGNLALQQMAFFIRQAGAFEATARNSALPAAQQYFNLGDINSANAPAILTGLEASGPGTPAADEVTVQSEPRANTVTRDCLGNTPSAGTWVRSRYFVQAENLMCQGDAANAAQSVAENVEDFQVRYMVQTGTDQASLSQWVNATAVTNWNNVTAVELCLQLRGDVGYGNQISGQFTNCAGTATNHDQFLRIVMRQTVQLRNRANNLG